MGELLAKVFAVFALIVFVTILVNHGAIDFSAWDKFTEKTSEAIQSEKGQEMIGEVKDTSYYVGKTFLDRFRLTAKKAADKADIEVKALESDSDFQEATLVRVVDGDTIVVITPDDGDSHYVRFIGVDAPESVNPDAEKNNEFGKAASELTKVVLSTVNTVYLQYDEKLYDDNDRLLAYVWMKPDVNINKKEDIQSYMMNGILARTGYAMDKKYPPNTKYADVFKELREEAQAENAGLWSYEGFRALWEEE